MRYDIFALINNFNYREKAKRANIKQFLIGRKVVYKVVNKNWR